jgi:hypothetical protein
VRTLQSTVRIPTPARTASKAAVEFEPRSRIMNLIWCALLAEVHDQVAGLLGGPFPGWMHSDSGDGDAPGGVLSHKSRMLAALIPQSRLVPLDSSNHLLPERDPAWKHFLAEIDRFLPGGR